MLVKANCKINLHLKITGKREDGYHNIETIFQEIDLYDELLIDESSDNKVEFSCSGLEIVGCSENICEKAARLLNEYAGTEYGCKIHLIKKVPLGAGLGGGSSDAAAVLKNLNVLWNLKFSDEILEGIAVKLGADVPFFVKGGSAFATGVGEKLNEIKPLLKRGFLAIVNPGLHINTGEAYKKIKYDLTNFETGRIFATVLENDLTVAELDVLFENDFEEYVFQVHPEVGKIKQLLKANGAEFCKMSGSGSTVYGYFKDQLNAEIAIKQFTKSWFKEIVKL